MDIILNSLQESIGVIITTVASGIGVMVIPLIGQAFSYLKAKSTNKKLTDLLDRIQVLVNSEVEAQISIVVPGIQNALVDDGKIDKEEVKELINQITQRILNQGKANSIAFIEKELGNTSDLIANLVTAKIAEYEQKLLKGELK